jgi:hypothetical protein
MPAKTVALTDTKTQTPLPTGYSLRAKINGGNWISRSGAARDHWFTIRVFNTAGERIGNGSYSYSDKGNLICRYIGIRESDRKLGLATAMHLEAERLSGKTLHPSPDQTDLGRSIWMRSDRPFGRGVRAPRRRTVEQRGYW